METFLNPAFLLSAAATFIALVGWFIRLESKANNNAAELVRILDLVEKFFAESKAHRKQIEDELYKHLLDQHTHYNEQAMGEFRGALEMRFQMIEDSLKQIDQKIDRLGRGRGTTKQ